MLFLSSGVPSFALPALAKAALDAGALDKAASYANEMLGSDPKGGNYGQAVHDGNMIRGLVTLRRGNVAQAAQDLLDAGKTSGSPVLNSFGPNVTLAKELLEKGERDAVLEDIARRSIVTLGQKGHGQTRQSQK
jgi:hypothetical protein